ncbi:hypothetical protein HYALB_00002092 [Hymenoscyphus albidus]|uniref:rRNA-processing protein EFG1 n=1 Tax=Hymenoscyphus albidus TaxID=595503 RepID=A0A9N9Q1L1_9HELO|nr:hypothetical protein HYALB_00002092 [Hymenoscyphus albidus]
MPGKRKHEESDPQETVHESRQFQVPGSRPKPSKKPRRFEPPAHKKQAHASSVNAIKKRIRDVSRRLERADDLPATVRMDDERALEAYVHELEAAEAEKIRQKMIGKYHMVRFFERKKAARILKKLRKQLLETTSEEEVEMLKTKMHIAEVDLSYTQYSPLSERYISLYPQKKPGTEEEDSSGDSDPPAKPPMWAEVEKCMEDGTLTQLRNRTSTVLTQKPKPTGPRLVKSKKKPKTATVPDTSGLNRRERRRQNRVQDVVSRKKNHTRGSEKNELFGASLNVKRNNDDDDNSDGGFFED